MTDAEIAQIAEGLSEAHKSTLMAIHESVYMSGFKLDYGEHGRPYKALRDSGLLSVEQFSDVGSIYYGTELGLRVRNHLQQQERDNGTR